MRDVICGSVGQERVLRAVGTQLWQLQDLVIYRAGGSAPIPARSPLGCAGTRGAPKGDGDVSAPADRHLP